MSGSCSGPRSRICVYTGYGSARLDGSSSCSRSVCDSAVVVIYLLCTRRVIAAQNVGAQLVELATPDRCADLVDEPDDEALVVDGAQRGRQDLLGLEQMVQVGAGVVRAGVAVAVRVDRAEVAPEAGVGDVEATRSRIHSRVAGYARRRHAVEGVSAGRHGVEKVIGLADAQQMSRLVGGQLAGHPAHDGGEVLLLERPTDAVAVETASVFTDDPRQTARSLAPQILVLRTLHHTEQRLRRL